MTMLPFIQQFKIKAAEGPKVIPGQECAHPACRVMFPLQRHHLVRRSFLAGDFEWIEYDGVKIANIAGLCPTHHLDVTDNKAAIMWNDLGYFEWLTADEVVGRLDPHPQVGEHTPREPRHYAQPEVCPTCKRPHRKQEKHEATRRRKSWTIHVPADERENGADVLDTLLEEARREMADAGLAYGDEDKARYFVLAAALGLFVQHSKEVLA